MRAATQRPNPLAFSDVVVWVACALMKGPSGESNVGSEGVKFLKTVRRQVEPATTIFPNFSVVDVYQVIPFGRKCNTDCCIGKLPAYGVR